MHRVCHEWTGMAHARINGWILRHGVLGYEIVKLIARNHFVGRRAT